MDKTIWTKLVKEIQPLATSIKDVYIKLENGVIVTILIKIPCMRTGQIKMKF